VLKLLHTLSRKNVHFALAIVPAQVSAQRCKPFLSVVLNHVGKLRELLLPEGNRPRLPGREALLHSSMNL
jgi:hypothetical protein